MPAETVNAPELKEIAGTKVVVAWCFAEGLVNDGALRMQADVSQVATGLKSVLLKPFAPLFRKRVQERMLPIVVTGAPHGYRLDQTVMKH